MPAWRCSPPTSRATCAAWALLTYLKDNPQALGEDAALFTRTSAQALQRRLATLEQQGAEALFGEPALQLEDLPRR
jgi:hypothetical protein